MLQRETAMVKATDLPPIPDGHPHVYPTAPAPTWKYPMPTQPNIDLLRQALEALDSENPDIQLRVAVALRRRLKLAPDVQPVAWMSPNRERLEFSRKDTVYGSHTIPLYTHPPAAAVQDLVAALMIIAGKQRCVDSLMSNVDIALEALKKWEGK
jgi:hypothetical protein